MIMVNLFSGTVYSILAVSLVAEALANLQIFYNLKKMFYGLVLVTCSFLVPLVLVENFSIVSLLLSIVLVYRVVNSFRAIYARLNQERLNRVAGRTSLVLSSSSIVLALLAILPIDSQSFLLGGLSVNIIIGLVLFVSTRRNLRKTDVKLDDVYIATADLPSVSVCIPARNETEQLATCLDSIIRSDYPKLEILVLDDCSQDKTSDVIKGYAHNGVRFIKGKPPANGWLGKNQAYQMLAEASSGEVLVFCGVDVRFNDNTISVLLRRMLAYNKSMISVMPKGLQAVARARLLQPMRYWWELVPPRRLFNRPPVLSTFWAIKKAEFDRLGQMGSVRSSILPEGYFARELAGLDKYSFVRSSTDLILHSAKKLSDQWQSSVRTRYPRLRSRLENVLFVTVLEFWLVLLPIISLIYGLISSDLLVTGLSLFAVLPMFVIHTLIIKAWGADRPLLAVVLLPVATISEILATLISMWRYEFSVVNWKDRDICIPVSRRPIRRQSSR